MPLKIYNSLTKREEVFTPIEDKHVKMYNCGPTVYDYLHIGNARSFLTAEMIRRYLDYKGYKVTFVQNITDIDDKIINRANELGVPASEIAKKFTDIYFEDMKSLRILEPTYSPKATDHVKDIIEFIEKLIKKGIAYEVDGDVYYDLATFTDYGKLSGQKLEDTLAGARIEINEKKRHPADFDLWKSAKPDEPSWDSPWGKGRPGWHIECSVMSSKYLGETFDIHSGGNDLLFPHHENEIAQSEGLTGKPLAHYWIHNGMLTIKGGKMSKSLGNIKIIRDLLKDYSSNAIRLYVLSAHYRAPIDLNDNSLDEANSAVERIKNCISLTGRLSSQGTIIGELNEIEKELNDAIDRSIQKFDESMDADFNTPGALASIFELVASANKLASNQGLSDNGKVILGKANATIISLCGVLGLDVAEEKTSGKDQELVDDLMKLIIEIRQYAREKKDWAIADKIRDGLANIGIKLGDTKEGTIWGRISK